MDVNFSSSQEGGQLCTVCFNRVDPRRGNMTPIVVVYEVVRHDRTLKKTNIPGFFGPRGCVRADTKEPVTLSRGETIEVEMAILAATQEDDQFEDAWS